MNKKIIVASVIILLAAGLWIGYKYHTVGRYRSKELTSEEKIALQKEKIALQKNMTLKEVMNQELLAHGTWPQIFKETSLDADLADTNKFFIVLVVPTAAMVAPFMPTEAAVKNCLERWNSLSLEKKIKVAKNYIISTQELWTPKDGTEDFKTLDGRKISITTKDFYVMGNAQIEINNVRAYDYKITRNGILIIMSDLVWQEDKPLFEC